MLEAAMESGSENDVAVIVKYARSAAPDERRQAGEDRRRLAQPRRMKKARPRSARPISSIW
jgi:hypothetical protein